MQEAREYLELKQKVLETAGVAVNYHLVVGEPPAYAILLAADELGADAIVMSTHGRSGMMRWVFGSVADRVLQRARVPILLTRVMPPSIQERQIPAIEDLADLRSHEGPESVLENEYEYSFRLLRPDYTINEQTLSSLLDQPATTPSIATYFD